MRQELRRSTIKAISAVGLFSLFIHLLVLAVPIYSLQVYDRVLSSQSSETLI